MDRPDGVCVALVSGFATYGGMKQLRADLVARTDKPLRALCLRLDRAVVACGEACLIALAAAPMLPVSVAIVVAPAMQELFQGYAWRAAERGYLRVVFTSPFEALQWSIAQARLAQSQALWVENRQAARALSIVA